MTMNFDRQKSLQDLERNDWGETSGDTYIMRTCHRLRRVPLSDFTDEDLRVMLGQQISLPFLVPLALDRLQVDPLLEAELYPGDLLGVVLKVPENYWKKHRDASEILRAIVARANEMLPWLDEADASLVRENLSNAPAFVQP
ncbi:contact-dependent growth inhibition system immunity protein [Bremerella sp. JC817]|uniref:contact-dependent growth inhibition system immunity protein n=1 Tax=Bremerella sp. JC817 TaxID=3231756 RepID=UPI0034588FB2